MILPSFTTHPMKTPQAWLKWDGQDGWVKTNTETH